MKFILNNERFLAGFTQRDGGVSEGAYRGLNLALHVGDDPRAVLKNREILAKNIGVDVRNLKFMEQIHSNRVEILRTLDDKLPECDGIITNLKGIALCVMVADCSPVLIIDKKREAIAAVHAGRAGVTGRICTKGVSAMNKEFGSCAEDLSVFVGANIKSGCYEIGELDLGEFNRYKSGGKLDMNAALLDEFAALGVKDVRFDPVCTHCDDRYFSYRRDGATGRFVGFAMIK